MAGKRGNARAALEAFLAMSHAKFPKTGEKLTRDKTRQQSREGSDVARCTVGQLIRKCGLRGVVHGKLVHTTIGDKAALYATHRVNRQFQAQRPNQLWVSDFTDVSISRTSRPGKDLYTSPL